MNSERLEKFEIGKCIRKKFDGMAYDGEIVSINLDTKFYRIGYTDRDEEDMTVSEVQSFGLPKRSTKRKEIVKNNKQGSNKMNDSNTACHTYGWV